MRVPGHRPRQQARRSRTGSGRSLCRRRTRRFRRASSPNSCGTASWRTTIVKVPRNMAARPSGRLMRANGTVTAREHRIDDDIGEHDKHGRRQQRARNIQNALDLARAVHLGADRAPQQPWDQKGLGADGDRGDRQEVRRAGGDAEQDRRCRQQQRLHDEQLQRRQDLTSARQLRARSAKTMRRSSASRAKITGKRTGRPSPRRRLNLRTVE